MRTPLFTSWFYAAALVLTAAAVSTRAEPQAAGGAPVLIDFRAVAEDGQPVADLTPADVTLRINGRPRPVKSLEFVRVGGEASAPVAGATLPPPFRTNAESSAAPGTRREVLIVLDELSISPGKEVAIRESLNTLVSALTPADRVALLSTRQGGPSHAFTQKHEEVRAALGRLAGHAPARLTDSDFACNAMLSLGTLRSAFGRFSPGSAPTLVYVSAALAGPAADRMASVGTESELCPLRTNHFEEVGAAAQASHAAMYVVHVLEAASASQTPQASQLGIDAVAGVTGADTIRLTGGGAESPLTRIARETSAYYLASFDVEPADRNGNRQRVQITVARERVRVNSRPNLVIPRGEPAAAKSVTPRDMIRVATHFTDLSLRGAAFPARNPSGKNQVLVVFEPVVVGTKINAAIVGLYDAKGVLKGQWTANADDLARSPLMAAILIDPGVYRMRIAATDASGRAGTLDADVNSELAPAGPLKVSALLLGTPAEGAPLAPKLEFGAGDSQVIAYVEVYGVQKGANVGVTLELAETEDGPAGPSAALPVAAGPMEDSRIARGGFNIASLPPGDIVIRAVVTIDGKPLGRVVRTLRKTK
jgi:VWFA-related protein